MSVFFERQKSSTVFSSPCFFPDRSSTLVYDYTFKNLRKRKRKEKGKEKYCRHLDPRINNWIYFDSKLQGASYVTTPSYLRVKDLRLLDTSTDTGYNSDAEIYSTVFRTLSKEQTQGRLKETRQSPSLSSLGRTVTTRVPLRTDGRVAKNRDRV